MNLSTICQHFHRCFKPILATTALLGSTSPARADLTVTQVSRDIFAHAQANGFQTISGPISSNEIGTFTYTMSAIENRAGAFVQADAAQDSNVPASGTTITGSGSAD